MNTRIATAVVIGLAAIGGVFSALRAQTTRTVWDGVYTEAQAKRGALIYDLECASCHGPAGAGGGLAPALTGAAFSANYDGLTVGDLFERNLRTMPIGREGELSRPQNADVTAYMLECNKFPAGKEELPTRAQALGQIKYVATRPETTPESRPPDLHQDDIPAGRQ